METVRLMRLITSKKYCRTNKISSFEMQNTTWTCRSKRDWDYHPDCPWKMSVTISNTLRRIKELSRFTQYNDIFQLYSVTCLYFYQIFKIYLTFYFKRKGIYDTSNKKYFDGGVLPHFFNICILYAKNWPKLVVTPCHLKNQPFSKWNNYLLHTNMVC